MDLFTASKRFFKASQKLRDTSWCVVKRYYKRFKPDEWIAMGIGRFFKKPSARENYSFRTYAFLGVCSCVAVGGGIVAAGLITGIPAICVTSMCGAGSFVLGNSHFAGLHSEAGKAYEFLDVAMTAALFTVNTKGLLALPEEAVKRGPILLKAVEAGKKIYHLGVGTYRGKKIGSKALRVVVSRIRAWRQGNDDTHG